MYATLTDAELLQALHAVTEEYSDLLARKASASDRIELGMELTRLQGEWNRRIARRVPARRAA